MLEVRGVTMGYTVGHQTLALSCAQGNFRQSAWWFGLLPLIRGFGFAFAIVVAINLPAAQVAIASVLLLAYVLAQASLKPWKARLINQMDMLLSASLLLLIRTSMQEDREKEESFARAWTLITLFFLSFCLTFMFLVSFLALLAQWRGRDAIRVLNMESIHAEEELRALKSCAEALLQVETDQLLLGMKKINAYDLKQISNTIEIMDDLLGTKFSSGSSRLRLSGANERYTAQFPGGVEAEQAASEAEDQTAQESNADELVKDDVEDIVKTEC